MVQVIQTISKWQLTRKKISAAQSVGFVPTMGNLHQGHLSLLQRSVKENALSVLSIFVNPTQFNDPSDYQHYPKTLAADCELAETAGVDFVFAPDYAELYPDDYRYQICEKKLSSILEGVHRLGHFAGVLTVVAKLLLLIKPHKTYFGEKDYQQLQLVKDLVQAFFIDTEIIGCETIRLDSGLPYSSRNQRLLPEEQLAAKLFPQIFHNPHLSCEQIKKQLIQAGFSVDYVEEYQNRRFAAVKLGQIRLIDNIVCEK